MHGEWRAQLLKELEQARNYERLVELKRWWDRVPIPKNKPSINGGRPRPNNASRLERPMDSRLSEVCNLYRPGDSGLSVRSEYIHTPPE